MIPTLKDDPLISWVAWRINKNKNCIIVINGPTGSGKTYAGIDLALKFSKKFGSHFTIQDNLDFKFTNLIKKMHMDVNLGPGTPYIFEEVGAVGGGAASREWQSRANRFFFSFLQTSRHRNQILIMTCPHFSYLEAGARPLVHCQMTMERIDFRNKKAYIKPLILQVSTHTGKIYFKYLRYRVGGVLCKLSRYATLCPPPEILDQYEALKLDYTTGLNTAIMAEEDAPKKRRRIQPASVEKLANDGYTQQQIADLFDTSVYNIRYILKNSGKLLKRGY